MLLSESGAPVYRLAICTPCQDTVSAGYALDLATLTARLTHDAIAHAVFQSRGTLLPQQRATLVQEAQAYGATHLLWLDADMRFPVETFAQLASHGEAIVACNYARRRHPILPTAEHREFGLLFTEPTTVGLDEVTQCGMGVMLVDMAVYAQIPEPWFVVGYNKMSKEYAGEDAFFCHQARTAGFRILIDQSLSRRIKHAGEMEWTADHTLTTRAAYEEATAV